MEKNHVIKYPDKDTRYINKPNQEGQDKKLPIDKLRKEVESLHLDVPEDIMSRVEEQVKLEENQVKITPGILNKELMSIAPEYKGKMRISILLACVGEVFSFASYFFVLMQLRGYLQTLVQIPLVLRNSFTMAY